MKIKYKENPGDLIKIPFKEGMNFYGRILMDNSCAIYDFISRDNSEINYESILNSEILFTAWLHYYKIDEGCWLLLKNIPLEENFKNFWPRYFNPNPASPECLGFYKAYKPKLKMLLQKIGLRPEKYS